MAKTTGVTDHGKRPKREFRFAQPWFATDRVVLPEAPSSGDCAHESRHGQCGRDVDCPSRVARVDRLFEPFLPCPWRNSTCVLFNMWRRVDVCKKMTTPDIYLTYIYVLITDNRPLRIAELGKFRTYICTDSKSEKLYM